MERRVLCAEYIDGHAIESRAPVPPQRLQVLAHRVIGALARHGRKPRGHRIRGGAEPVAVLHALASGTELGVGDGPAVELRGDGHFVVAQGQELGCVAEDGADVRERVADAPGLGAVERRVPVAVLGQRPARALSEGGGGPADPRRENVRLQVIGRPTGPPAALRPCDDGGRHVDLPVREQGQTLTDLARRHGPRPLAHDHRPHPDTGPPARAADGLGACVHRADGLQRGESLDPVRDNHGEIAVRRTEPDAHAVRPSRGVPPQRAE